MDITMDTHVVSQILQKNKQKHIEEYKLQLDGWKAKMEEYNDHMKGWATNGGVGLRPKEPIKPHNYLETYDKYINMLGNHTDLRIVISEFQYEELINDNFNWKSGFVANTTLYSNGDWN
jgi:hypothetical protein